MCQKTQTMTENVSKLKRVEKVQMLMNRKASKKLKSWRKIFLNSTVLRISDHELDCVKAQICRKTSDKE